MRRARSKGRSPFLLVAVASIAGSGCSLNQMAVNAVANSLSSGGTSAYATDDDPILVAEALPFSLKLMESILQSTPKHEGLLTATASGFVQYAHAFVLRPAVVTETVDFAGARAGRARAKRLFLRARGYAERALEVRRPGTVRGLTQDLEGTLLRLEQEDIPSAYWLAAAIGSAISVDKSDMELVADLPIVHGILTRALDMDEAWSEGTLHEFAIALAGGSGGDDGTENGVEYHFERAMELNGGRSIGPLVAMAETVAIQEQDLSRFRGLLGEALAFDVNAHPDLRLANTLAQQHAQWLLSQEAELFITTTASR